MSSNLIPSAITRMSNEIYARTKSSSNWVIASPEMAALTEKIIYDLNEFKDLNNIIDEAEKYYKVEKKDS